MALAWAERRQVLYYIVGIVILGVLLVAGWRIFFVHTPSCFDKVQNGNETGVDCGGSCALLCPDTARAPAVLWARSFETSPGVYSAAAYVQNNNVSQGAGARQVHYSFQLLDSDNVLIVERDGVIDIPPQQTVPVIESGINVGTRTPAKTFFAFDNAPISWNKINTQSLPALRIAQTSPYQDGKLTVTIANDSLVDAKKVSLAAVLFDSSGTARAASKSVIAKIARKSDETVVFTWPGDFPDIVRAEVTILPSF